MTSPLDRAAETLARAGPRRLALAWAAVTLLALALLSRGPGVSRDEAESLAAADRQAMFYRQFPRHPSRALSDLDSAVRRPRPPLAEAVFGLTRLALGGSRSGLTGYRIGAALFGALLSFALALLGHAAGGPALAVLAPALFWFAPRHLHQGLVATPDLPEATLWVAAFLVWRRSLIATGRRERLRWALSTGLAFGAAAAIRSDGWALLPVLGLHAGFIRVHRWWNTRRDFPAGRAPPPGEGPAARRRVRLAEIPPAVLAMLVLGPLTVLAAWPWLWRAPLASAGAAFASTAGQAWPYLGQVLRGPSLPLLYPLAVTALTLPAAVLAAVAGGLLHAAARIARAVRSGAPAEDTSDDALLLLGALGPLALAAAGLAPFAPGLRPWLPAMPFLALLAARAIVAAAAAIAPSRARETSCALALLALYPSLRSTVHHWPHGASAWNELAGGAPGAASLGMARQDGGEPAAAALPALAAHARPGARVWWAGIAPEAVAAYRGAGRLRPDLADAEGPEVADLAVVPAEGRPRELEFRAWTAFRTARPAAGVYLDEVPLAQVYARPGAWR